MLKEITEALLKLCDELNLPYSSVGILLEIIYNLHN